jgi:hypothetical protein
VRRCVWLILCCRTGCSSPYPRGWNGPRTTREEAKERRGTHSALSDGTIEPSLVL